MEDVFHLGVKGLIRNQKGEILLLKVNILKFNNNTEPAYWDIPGGRIKRGDSILETLKREVKEEIGVSISKNIEPFTMVLSNIRIPVGKDDVGLVLASYICEIASGSKIKLSDEHIEAKWFSPKSAAALLGVKYPKEFTERIRDL